MTRTLVTCLLALGLLGAAWAASGGNRPTTTIPQPPVAVHAQPTAHVPVGKTFQDCLDVCPVMVVIPAGRFTMGSPVSEAGRTPHEGPQIGVQIAAPYAIGKFEITSEQYAACYHDQVCKTSGDGGPGLPVTFIEYYRIREYVDWLSKKTGRVYDIPSEAEWEYAARAGTATAYWWGNTPLDNYENIAATLGGDCCIALSPVGTMKPNGFGLYDMLGNAREMVGDCENKYQFDLSNTPHDGGAYYDQPNRPYPPPWVCAIHIVRGGSITDHEVDSRAAVRRTIGDDIGAKNIGFRIVTHDITMH